MNFKKALSYLLVGTITLSSTFPAYAEKNNKVLNNNFSYMQNDQKSITIYNDGISINGKYFTQKEFETLLESAIPLSTSSEPTPCSAAALVAGTWFIPGVGEVVITAAGVILVAGATVAVGSWVYNKVITYFKEHTKKQK